MSGSAEARRSNGSGREWAAHRVLEPRRLLGGLALDAHRDLLVLLVDELQVLLLLLGIEALGYTPDTGV